ncbi:hypothetical protein LSM04_001777 [Trypanosoma melophagium]|uniref:uncharacterized protein n=1 Tax=Trypanosoma melophagium TaxID=715481 RepID=UPI00351A81AB|nr:hypothetical protein LSM04_001777 [Trypanosoma melophagium]
MKTSLHEPMGNIFQRYADLPAELQRRQLGHMWVAKAMANQADEAQRSLTLDSLAMRANRYKFASPKPHDIADAIVRLGFPVFAFGLAHRGERHESLPALPEEGTQEANSLLHPVLFVQTGSRCGLPPLINAGKRPESGEPLPERKFMLGAKFTGPISRKKGASSGYYASTRNPKEAVIGVYRPVDEANWPKYDVADATMCRKRKGRQARLPDTTKTRPTETHRTTERAPRKQQLQPSASKQHQRQRQQQ